tara:strand:- start:36 stop:248 length:213 start_codon:yes stop_codon:yes gene_type:complete
LKKKWLNKNELKEYVGFSIGKIDSMMKNNEISYSKVGKNVRFDKNEVDNLNNKGINKNNEYKIYISNIKY